MLRLGFIAHGSLVELRRHHNVERRILDALTLADYVRTRGYGADFLDLYLVPMSSAVWSTPPAKCTV